MKERYKLASLFAKKTTELQQSLSKSDQTGDRFKEASEVNIDKEEDTCKHTGNATNK